jgi:hypothetical protein
VVAWNQPCLHFEFVSELKLHFLTKQYCIDFSLKVIAIFKRSRAVHLIPVSSSTLLCFFVGARKSRKRFPESFRVCVKQAGRACGGNPVGIVPHLTAI